VTRFIVCGLSAEVAGSFEQLWRAKLREARVTDLETTPVPEGLAGEVLAQIRGVFSVQEDLPMDLASVVRRIETLVSPARREVLASHPWGCAQEEEIVSALRRSMSQIGLVTKLKLHKHCVFTRL
jgi:hypothetical protein